MTTYLIIGLVYVTLTLVCQYLAPRFGIETMRLSWQSWLAVCVILVAAWPAWAVWVLISAWRGRGRA